MKWRGLRWTAILLSLLLLCQGTALAAKEQDEQWRRTEGDGSYVTVRLKAGEDLTYSESGRLAVRYADTKEPVPLGSDVVSDVLEQQDGFLFATVPASEADRPLEVFSGEEPVWTDLKYPTAPLGTDFLYIRGIIQGDEAGRLNKDKVLTRAEAFAIAVRLLSLEPSGDPGYEDVSPENWYYDTASAARAAGIASADTRFRPNDPVTRAELTVLLARAMEAVGWLELPEAGDRTELPLKDAESIPAWALGAYLVLAEENIGIYTRQYTEKISAEGYPITEIFAEPGKEATRGEMISMVYDMLRWLPVYPTDTAIAWGFDEAMPEIDGSTSTYPYTSGLYSALFSNYSNHPQFPESHSKSYESYERLISGEVDVLFAATKASQEQEDQAKKQGITLEYIPIAKDAMVFFTNEENPVQGLTTAQIQDIYVRSAYRNWKEVGGPDAALLPYCRNTDSGSHALMERYFLEGGDLSLSDSILQGNVSLAMSTALTDVAAALSLDPPAYAIGYSVYGYYEGMESMMGDVTSNRLHLLAVDGVMPTDETVSDGSYPLADYNYIVLRSDEPQNSPARQLAKFMLSREGQLLVERQGFLPVRK